MSWDSEGTMRSDWNFDTIKSTAAMGTFRSMAKDLMSSSGMEIDENGEDDAGDLQGSIDTTAATQGSDPLPVLGGLGMNSQAAHSTVIIRPTPEPTLDTPELLASGDNSSGESLSSSPETPSQKEYSPVPLGAPPAYTGSVRSTRRSSYAERNAINGMGMVLREADLGNGVDTIRPMKKVDTVGSLRLSAEFVGSARRDGSSSLPPSPSKSSSHKRAASEAAKAGKAVINEVILPILQNVRSSLCLVIAWRLTLVYIVQAIRDDIDAREIEALSMISRGFAELKDVNPELSYGVILDILSGINEYVFASWIWNDPNVYIFSVTPPYETMFTPRVVYFRTNG
jgi:serine/threonine-protein kinase 24/25/MST4